MLQDDEGEGTEHLTESIQHITRSELAHLFLYVQFISVAKRHWFSKGQVSCQNTLHGMSLSHLPWPRNSFEAELPFNIQFAFSPADEFLNHFYNSTTLSVKP